MEHFSVWHWLVLIILWTAFFIPLWRIVGKTGNHPALSLLFLVPIVNVIFLWILAFTPWPATRRTDPG